MNPAPSPSRDVLRVRGAAPAALERFATRFGVTIHLVENHAVIPASFWGEPEAGVADARLWVRGDTPIHSLLHEVAHVLCARAAGRRPFVRDAGSDDLEECAVCYLQVLLADELPPMTRARMWRDMDRWGYTFREGSARRWFFGDGVDGRDWLVTRGALTPNLVVQTGVRASWDSARPRRRLWGRRPSRSP